MLRGVRACRGADLRECREWDHVDVWRIDGDGGDARRGSERQAARIVDCRLRHVHVHVV